MATEEDRLAIMNQLGRFARILDDRDWSAVQEVFADDLTFDYGDGCEKTGIDALLAQFRQFLDVCGPSQHMLGSLMLTFEGELAVTRAYVQARHQGAGDKADRYLDTSGEYIDRWQCRSGRWLIVRRDARWFMNKGDFSVLLAEGSKFVLDATGGNAVWSVSNEEHG
jgi:ketosteroid isomerase-like protein